MSEAEILDAETVGHDLVVRPQVGLVPTTTAQELVQRLDVIRGAMNQAMQKDIDYGVIPGTGKKPTLLKPGAEKLAVLFQLDVQLANEKTWSDDGHLTVVSRATVWHIPSGARVASGEGICSTREAKYAFRQSERFCPTCGVAAIIKGKAEYGGGWVCFKKKGGCGAKYADDDRVILDQPSGQVPNPNIADTYNTVDKMASKRARVDAVLAATGASALFTQDAEDLMGEPTAASATPERSSTGSHAPVASAPVAAGEQASPVEDDGLFPPVDAPADTVFLLEKGSPAWRKLNVLVGTLRSAGHITTYQLWMAMRPGQDWPLGEDGLTHWSTLRDTLTKDEASGLIGRLERLERNVAGSDFAQLAAEAIAKRADAEAAK